VSRGVREQRNIIHEIQIFPGREESPPDASGLVLPVDRHLVVVGVLKCLIEPESYVGLVGSPMLDRSRGRDQTKSGPLALQVGGWAQG